MFHPSKTSVGTQNHTQIMKSYLKDQDQLMAQLMERQGVYLWTQDIVMGCHKKFSEFLMVRGIWERTGGLG